MSSLGKDKDNPPGKAPASDQSVDNETNDNSFSVEDASDYIFDEMTGILGEPRMIRPHRTPLDFFLYVFTIPRLVLIGLLIIGVFSLRRHDDLPTRSVSYFAPDKEQFSKRTLTHLDRVRLAHKGELSWVVKTQQQNDATGETTEREERVSCQANTAGLAGPSVQHVEDEINSKFASNRQFVVLNLILWMVVFMVEGIPPEMSILVVIIVSYFLSWIKYDLPLSDYCVNAPIDKKLTVEPLLFLEDGKQIFSGLASKNTLLYAGMFVLSAAFTETKILEKLLGALIGSPTTHGGVMARLMLPAMLLSSVCPNGPVTQMCMPLVVAVTDKTGLWSPRVYYMALAFLVTIGGNLLLIGSTPCIYALGTFKTTVDGKESLQTQMCRETLAKAHGWDVESEGTTEKTKVWNVREKTEEDGFRFTNQAYEDIVEKQCSFGTFDGGFFFLALAVCAAAVPAGFYAISVFAADEMKAKGVEGAEMTQKNKYPDDAVNEGGAMDEDDPHLDHDKVDSIFLKEVVPPASGTLFSRSRESIREETAFGAEDEGRRTSVQLTLQEGIAASAELLKDQDDEVDVSDADSGLRKRDNSVVAFKFTDDDENPGGQRVVEEKEPLLLTSGAGRFLGEYQADLEQGRSPRSRSGSATVRSRTKNVNGQRRTTVLRSLVPSELKRRGTTTGDAIEKYDSQVEVLPTYRAAENKPACYDVEFRVHKNCKALIGLKLVDTVLYKMPDVQVYLHVSAGVKKPQFARTEEELPPNGALSVYFGDSCDAITGKNEPVLRHPADVEIRPNCILGIRASAKTIGKLSRQFAGLTPHADYYDLLGRSRKTRQMYEVVLSPEYFQNHHTSKNLQKRFFLEHDACILGADPENFGFVLVEGFAAFGQRSWKDVKLTSAVAGSRPPRSVTLVDTLRGMVAFLGFLTIITLSAIPDLKIGNFKIEDQFANLIIALGVSLVALRCITWNQALGSMNPGVLLLFAFAEALQTIMGISKTSQWIAESIAHATNGSRPAAVFGTGIVVSILTQFLNNATCTQMLWDSTMQLCLQSAIPFKPMACLLAQASGFAFCTPIGMPPTLLVRVPGNYSFSDYVRAGWLMQLCSTLLCCALVALWVAFETRNAETGAPNEELLFWF